MKKQKFLTKQIPKKITKNIFLTKKILRKQR